MSVSYSTQGEPSLEQLINVEVENPNNDEAVLYEDGVWKNKAVLTPSSLPSGSSGDVIISDGAGGINSTNRLNVNPSNGYITGSYINLNASSVKLGSGAISGTDTVAIGYQAGFGGNNGSVSIGSGSGITAGNASVSIGNGATAVDNNSIVINATGSPLLSSVASCCYIDPLRDITVGALPGLPFIVHYDDATKEMFKSVDIQTRNAFVKGYLEVNSTASLYGGQLTAGVGGNKIVAGAGNNNLVVDLTNEKVAINKATPDEELDINGTLRIEADTTQTIRFYDTQGGGSPDEDGRIEVTQDGGGGEMKFYTLETGSGTPQERLSINRRGALGLSGNYGLAGQVLTSNDAGNAVSWTTPTAPTPVFGSFDILGGNFNLITNNYTTITALKEQTGVSANGMSVNSATGIITLDTAGLYLLNAGFTIGQQGGGGGLDQAILFVTDEFNNAIKMIATFYDNAGSDGWRNITLSGHAVIPATTSPYKIMFRALGSTNGSLTSIRSGNQSSGVSLLKIA